MNDYIRSTDKMFFKHEASENLSCDTYSMHTHNSYELLFFLEGKATHVIEDRKYKLKKGDLILIRPLKYHFIQIDEPARYERYDILFDPQRDGIESAKLLPEDLEVISVGGNRIIEDIFQKMDLYRQNSDDATFERLLACLLCELFYNLSLFFQTLSQTPTTLSPLISRALKYMNENLGAISGIQAVAEQLFISESYFYRLFQKELHKSPKKYLLEKRLILAQKLLLNGEKPTAVFRQCGFGDYTSFYRNYLSFFGYPPSALGKPR